MAASDSLKSFFDSHPRLCSIFNPNGDSVFDNQTVYECHTCQLLVADNRGICAHCAKFCHKGHHVTQRAGSLSWQCDCLIESLSRRDAEWKCLCIPPHCTHLETGRQFTVQPWFHCTECDLAGNSGICATCAATCHRGHRGVRFHKRSPFFCDCGAGGCQRAVPRAPGYGRSPREDSHPPTLPLPPLPPGPVERLPGSSNPQSNPLFGLLNMTPAARDGHLRQLNLSQLDRLMTFLSESFPAVQRTTTDKRRLEEETRLTCPICCDREREVVLNPCGHMYCRPCAERLRTCALCRAHVTGLAPVIL